jgi:AcrR family transcriptional regulator
MTGETTARGRNPRGAGGRLRDDIVAAARDLLVEQGHETAVTLRGVARRVGIAAPSIYPHFDSPEAIVQAVVVETFHTLGSYVSDAIGRLDDPRERLLAGCRAYITFGIENPNLYGLLFSRNRQLGGQSPEGRPLSEEDLRGGAFGLLVGGVDDCIRAGISSATSAPATAIDIWVAMHGIVSLRGAQYQMPWPPRDVMEPPILLALARIQP